MLVCGDVLKGSRMCHPKIWLGVQGMLAQIMLRCYIDYFELRHLENRK